MHDEGFHEGELLAQRRAGVCAEAARLATMLEEPAISAGMGRFIAERELVFLTSVDMDGRLWTSPLFGPPGFCKGQERTLTIAAIPTAGDPLRDLSDGRPAGVLVVDFARRRRLRINGVVHRSGTGGLEIAVEQAFGNCPRYIRPRQTTCGSADPVGHAVRRTTRLEADDVELITGADTFVLGTIHRGRGADTSHRGGEPGFMRFSGGSLWWPDLPGNNLFNSIGNILVDPLASLLVLDSGHGQTLQMTGHATVDWLSPDERDEATGRRVRFTPEAVIRWTTAFLADEST